MLHRMLGVSVLAALIGTPAIAQVMEDSTVGTMVSGTGPYTVTGGTTQLTTLFHSFAEFSPNTNAVTFALDGSQSTIDVVIGRVTGSNSSLIDGQLTLTGGNTPDLFLLNPNGITFGQNASLLLPGSFLATTAKSVEFNNNQSFSTNNPGSAPMLTISTPMGLQFGASAAPLQINNANLAVNAVQNLSFVGGDVTVAGGSLSAPGGRLQIAGIDSNNRLDLDADGAFDTDGLAIRGAGGFRDLVIDQGANLSVNDQGFVTLLGNDTTVTNGAQIEASAIAGNTAGSIELLAAGNLLINQGATLSTNTTDTDSNGAIRLVGERVTLTEGGTLYNQTSGTGDAGNIIVVADNFELISGGNIFGDTSGAGRGGDLNISADVVLIEGVGFGIGASSDGDAGNITITATDAFTLTQAGFNTNASGSGDAGDVTITAGDLTIFDAGFGTDTTGSGDAGDVILTANTIAVDQGGFGTSTSASGNAGNATLIADTIVVRQSGFGVDTFGSGNAGTITIEAGNLLLEEDSGFGAATDGTGDAGLINIEADNFTLRNSGIGVNVNANAQDAMGGQININVNDTLLMEQSGIGTDSFGDGDAGDLTVTAQNLIMTDSGIGSGTHTASDAGTLTVVADSVVMNNSGLSSSAEETSTGNSGTVNVTASSIILNESEIRTTLKNTASNGDGGEINIQADSIVLQELDDENRRASIESQNLGNGNSGDINIIAGDIDVQGGLIANAKFGDGAGGQYGNAGSIKITADNLYVQDGGELTVSGVNGGNAGNLAIAAGFINLNDGRLRAETNDGDQGNIILSADRGILLRQQSLINTNATGTASGGNIILTTPFLLSLENSDIAANAIAGNGGNITITTQGIFGAKFRDQLTSENDITASSESGLSGTVTINNFGVDPNSDLVALPNNLIDNSNRVIQGCSNSHGNELIRSGRGGVPSNPIHSDVQTTTLWQDFRPPMPNTTAHTPAAVALATHTDNPLAEATIWQTNMAGQVELTTTTTGKPSQTTCQGHW